MSQGRRELGGERQRDTKKKGGRKPGERNRDHYRAVGKSNLNL